ncbi:GTPase-activating protein, putative [Candida dubliniensis CD36]|uniref:Oxidant-induced cell-cycle arrest protein 5 n=1 Tax=Candida dubliniensis (strain CD36 / ATCC MYA-646 / CBS 7987 / NCPF 3949 / NRRL Y-17841) TaxID=573826 RepID=B9WGD4_CANDC|nr:GTPase-activating protein, putative [Candida dubliniensis CD36]CAX42308.1 GTPase-activating protein, putative [Candida dubliniensis CD36]
MGKKKQEMSQVYNGSKNEFIFGEQGGKGRNLSSFLKNLSLTGSSASVDSHRDSYEEVNSNIYGSLSYSKNNRSAANLSSGSIFQPRPASGGNRTVSLGHIGRHQSPKTQHRRSHSNTRYTDLDDDWDAGLDEVVVKPNPPPMLDSLYPDLTVQLPSEVPEKKQHKESMDDVDLQAKAEINKLNQLNSKYSKFRKILASDTIINLQDLRKLSWNGIPNELRALSWLLLLGYLPTNKSRQSSTLKRKRQEYLDGLGSVTIEFHEDPPDNNSNLSLSNVNRDKQLYHQIKIDVKRTNPTLKLYSYSATQVSLRKILYLWAVRHPASGYVQGINDLSTPFYQIFLNNYIWQLQRKQQGELEDEDLFIPGYMAGTDEEDPEEQKLLNDPQLMQYNLENFNTEWLSARVTSIIEADTYWCLSRLLENITDNYIHQQPGIIRQVNELKNLISKIDVELLNHFEQEGIEFIQFSFRWMNCLLMRELPMQLIIRMWDTYLSETPLGFNTFHTYVCAAFLIKFSSDLKEKDFQEIILFLQNPPTSSWTEKDVELMLSEAYIWQSLYKNASAHLR